MNLLFTDLDNTLIYSHRHLQSEDVRWVETLNNKRQSFMTASTYDYFCNQKDYVVVPVTTRSFAQYSRLQQMSTRLGWNNALICNGAILLHNNLIVPEWLQESIDLCKDADPDFTDAYSKCLGIFGKESIVLTEHFMFYIKATDVDGDYASVQSVVNNEFLAVLKDSRKIYVFPQILNKGTAIKRYMKLVKKKQCIAAGDSEFDLPMLECADISLCSSFLKGKIEPSEKIIFINDNFSNHICEELKKISLKGESV